jgi:hypothetical protein
MASSDKPIRNRRIYIRVTDAEYDKINSQFVKSTCRTMSEYIRKIIFNKPVKIYHRNQSLDDLMIELIVIRYQLSAIGNNYNQEVKRLHVITNQPEAEYWIERNRITKELILERINGLKQRIDEINDIWLQ